MVADHQSPASAVRPNPCASGKSRDGGPERSPASGDSLPSPILLHSGRWSLEVRLLHQLQLSHIRSPRREEAVWHILCLDE